MLVMGVGPGHIMDVYANGEAVLVQITLLKVQAAMSVQVFHFVEHISEAIGQARSELTGHV